MLWMCPIEAIIIHYRKWIVLLAICLSASTVFAQQAPQRVFNYPVWLTHVAWNADASRFIACTRKPTPDANATVQYSATVYDAQTGQALFLTPSALPNGDAIFPCFTQSADQNRFFTVFDTTVQIWDVNTSSLLVTFNNQALVTRAWWSMDESRILILAGEGQMNLWDTSSGKLLQTRKSDWSSGEWGIDYRWVVNENVLTVWDETDNRVEAWDVMTGERLSQWTIKPPAGFVVWRASVSPDGNRAVFGFYSDNLPLQFPIQVIDTRSNIEITTFLQSSPLMAVSWMPNSHRFIAQMAGSPSYFWDANTGEQGVGMEMENIGLHIVWSPDRTLFALGLYNLGVWKADGTPVLTFPLKFDGSTTLSSAQWSADGRRIMIEYGKYISVIDLPSGKVVQIGEGFGNAVWSKDARHILSWTELGQVGIWDLP